MKVVLLALGFVLSSLVISNANAVTPIPTVVGTCAVVNVSRVTTRLEDQNGHSLPDTGSAILFSNGGGQVSYDQIPEVDESRVGDQVVVCLVALPTDCPPDDDRGKIFTTTNLRTMRSWTLPDSAHGCGGA